MQDRSAIIIIMELHDCNRYRWKSLAQMMYMRAQQTVGIGAKRLHLPYNPAK
jgi:hypothetical protein